MMNLTAKNTISYFINVYFHTNSESRKFEEKNRNCGFGNDYSTNE